MSLLAICLTLPAAGLLLAAAAWLDRRLRRATARMVVGPRWTPEAAESIVAKELADLFTRQSLVRAASHAPRRPLLTRTSKPVRTRLAP